MEPKYTTTQTSPSGGGSFAYTFCCITGDPPSLFVSRIQALVIRLSAISHFVTGGLTGLFLWRIFLAQLVGLFPARLSHQDTRGQPGASLYLACFLPQRESSRIPPRIISCGTGYPNLSRHDAGEDEYRPASYSSRLSVSLSFGFAYGDPSPSPPFARAVTDWDPARLHGYIVAADRAASACVF